MEETDLIKTNREIKRIIKSNLYILNKKSRDYINDIMILINREVGISKILSIMLFGSQISNHDSSSIFSDCDLLVIFKDRVSDHHIKEIERYFLALEVKHNFNMYDHDSHLFKKILAVIQQTTGMFISHFLTKQKYWEEINFAKIFRVNKVFSDVFAPKKIVTSSVVDNSIVIYGHDLRNILKEQIVIPTFDMIKSVIMNLVIAIFAIVISPFYKFNPIKYSLEAVKWALRASNYYSFKDSISLQSIIKRFLIAEKSTRSKEKARKYYQMFLELRIHPNQNIRFMIQCLMRILQIHIRGIKLNKFMEMLRSK